MKLKPSYFFALCPDKIVRGELEKYSRLLIEGSASRVKPVDFHVTLAYLGHISSTHIDRIVYEVEHSSPLVPSFDLQLSGVCYWEHSNVLWVGFKDTPLGLRQLVDSLKACLLISDFIPEARPYVPHVTLARRAKEPEKQSPTNFSNWSVDEFFLMRSSKTLSRRYDIVRTFRLY